MTDIAALESYAGELSEAAQRSRAASEKQHQYIHNDALTDVVTEAGLVPSIAKQARLTGEKTSAALEEVAAQMAGAMTYATTAAGLAGTLNGGFFSVPSPENTEYLILYKNNSGMALEIKRYPSSGKILELEEDIGGIAGVVKGRANDDYILVFTDKRDRMALGIKKTGQVSMGEIDDLADYARQISNNTFQTVTHDTDYIASWVDALKQIALAITKAGNVVVGGNLVFNGDLLTAEGRADSRLDRGFLDGRSAKRVIVCPGDSMTNGYSAPNNSYPKQLAALLPGRDIVNLGISSNTSVQIAARMGAVSGKFSVVGGTIPRSGVVTLTAGETPSNLSTNSMDLEFDGTLFGVPGKLHVGAGAGTTAPTFTRANAGDVVHVPDNSPFVLKDVGFYRDSIQVIWSGRNDGNAATVLANIAKMVSLMPHSRFIVLSVCTRTTETSGTSGYTYVNGLNAQLKLMYPNNFVDVLTPLIAAYNPSLPDDVTAHTGNTIPPSLSTDGTHLTAAGYAIVAQLIFNFLISRGW